MTEENKGGAEVDAREASNISFTPQPVAQIAQSTGVLNTAKTRIGGVIATRAVQDDDLVTVSGVELSVKNAVLGGFLTRGADGNIGDVDEAAFKQALSGDREAAEKKAKAEEDAKVQEYAVGMEPENSKAIASMMSEIDALGVNPASELQHFIGNPDRLPPALTHIAREKGRDEGAELQRLRGLAADMTVGVEDLLITKGNFDPAALPAFWNWARAHQQLDLRRAALAAVMQSDGRGYLALAEKFSFAHGRGRGVSGFPITTVRIGQTAVEVIDIPGRGRMRLDAARKAGLA